MVRSKVGLREVAAGAFPLRPKPCSLHTGVRQPNVVTPLMMLRDADLTKVLIVTLPETTPVLEAQALQEDVRRAGIEPFAWVINASLWAARPTDPVLWQRADAEVALIRRVANDLARRVALVPFQVGDASGTARLRELAGLATGAAALGGPL